MTELYELHEEPELESPIVIAMLTGWIDAGGAGQMAMTVLEEEWSARPIATFDADTFIDYRARRPIMELRDGVNTNLAWPSIQLKSAKVVVPFFQDPYNPSGSTTNAASAQWPTVLVDWRPLTPAASSNKVRPAWVKPSWGR